MSSNIKDKEFYVHVPDEKVSIKIPSKEQVPDVKITHERWILSDVKVKCIGKIKVFDAIDPGFTYTYGNNKKATLYKWKYEWMNKYMKESEEYITEMKSRGEYRLKKFMDKYKYVSDTNFDANSPGVIRGGETGTIMLNGKETPVRFKDSSYKDEKPLKAARASRQNGQKHIKLNPDFIKHTKGKDLQQVLNHEQGHLLKNKKSVPDRNDPEYDEFDKKVEPLLKSKVEGNKHTSLNEFEADKYSADKSSSKDVNKALRRTRKYVTKKFYDPKLKEPGSKAEKEAARLKYHRQQAGGDNDLNLRSKALKINDEMKKNK